MGPGEILCKAGQIGHGRAPPELKYEDALPVMAHEGGAAHVRMAERHALHPERIEPSPRVFDPGGTPAEQPQTTPCVEESGIPRAVPGGIAHGELVLGVSVTMEVSGEDVGSADDDLPGLPGRQAGGDKFCFRIRSNGFPPLVVQDPELNGRDRKTGWQATTAIHLLTIRGIQPTWGQQRNRLRLGGAVDGGYLGARSNAIQRGPYAREDRSTSGDDLAEGREAPIGVSRSNSQRVPTGRGTSPGAWRGAHGPAPQGVRDVWNPDGAGRYPVTRW